MILGVGLLMPIRPGYKEIDPLSVLLVLGGLLLSVVSMAVIVGARLARRSDAKGNRPWQFSLRELLVTMTIVAILLGLIVYATK